MRDHCVQCGRQTMYDHTDHIDVRYGYVEGVGQLCIPCYINEGSSPRITIPLSLIKDNPNDADLGFEVRKLYWESGGGH